MKSMNGRIIETYCIPKSIPKSALKDLFKVLNLNIDSFNEYMTGQTTFRVGKETMYFYDDVVRFANNQPCID